MYSTKVISKTLMAVGIVSAFAIPGLANAQSKSASDTQKMAMPMGGSQKMTMPMGDSQKKTMSAGDSQKMTMPMGENASKDNMDLMGAMTKMHSQMDAMKMSGNVDEDFAMMMRVHHQGAIDMSKVELANGKNAEMRKTAQKAIDDQTKEIKKLDQWMAKKGHSMK